MSPARIESQIIQLVEKVFRPGHSQVQIVAGIGDDAAVIQFAKGSRWALSTDAFLEGVHFLPHVHSPQVAGGKALARALSDLAAVGATPRFFLLNMAVPTARTGKWLAAFLRGMAGVAKKTGVTLVGGDTSRPLTGNGFSANLTVVGEFVGCEPVFRSGARPGDTVFLTGVAGAAQLGLEIVHHGLWRERSWRPFLRKHFQPEPRIEFGAWLAREQIATAMIDTSDGLSSDLRNLCTASRVGAVVDWMNVPAVEVPAELQRQGVSRRAVALHGGDDYELLFTVAPRNVSKIPRKWESLAIHEIGNVIRGTKLYLIEASGERGELPALGWDPFRKTNR